MAIPPHQSPLQNQYNSARGGPGASPYLNGGLGPGASPYQNGPAPVPSYSGIGGQHQNPNRNSFDM